MINIISALAVFSFAMFFSSCAGSKPEVEAEVEDSPRDRMVARVASVNAEAKYVLIQRFGKLEIPEDSVLYTIGSATMAEKSAASIKVTGERLGQFLAADIITGKLEVGDAVYLRTLDIKMFSELE